MGDRMTASLRRFDAKDALDAIEQALLGLRDPVELMREGKL